MRYFLKMRKFLNSLLDKKTFDLDNDGKIESLRDEVSGLFSQFKRISEKIDDVNLELDAIMEEEILHITAQMDRLKEFEKKILEDIKKSDLRIEKAKDERKANDGLKENVSKFLP